MMSTSGPLSLAEIDERIAIVRDNIRQLIEQAAAASGAEDESQNRQQDIDRKAAKDDYDINVKAELEIELLHQKVDQLREMEILNLTQAVKNLTDILHTAKIEITPAK